MFVNLPSERLARKETTEKNTYDSFKDITPEEL